MSDEFKLEVEDLRLGPATAVIERTEEEKLSHRVMLNLYDYWNDHKHLRLCQIIFNAYSTLPESEPKSEQPVNDIFYLPDERLLVGLENLRNLTDAQRECKKTSQS